MQDSFNSKQTNEYMADLFLKHKLQTHPEIKEKEEDWDAESCKSGDTAKLSFSKEDKETMEPNYISSDVNTRQIYSPQMFLQTQSINSIGELLKDRPGKVEREIQIT